VIRRGFGQEVNETEHLSDWSELGARILEVAAAATAIHLSERASDVVMERSTKGKTARVETRGSLTPE
jgi:hypothetical protein